MLFRSNASGSSQYAKSYAHLIPRKMEQPGTIFGTVPTDPRTNLLIRDNPQIYMSGELPNIPGLTTIPTKKYGDISTGIVASEAAKHHAMTATLAMQSEAEIADLKKTIALTGTVTSEFTQTFDEILPITTNLVNNAALESEKIVSSLRAGEITLEEAKAKIIALNARIEQQLASATQGYAAANARNIGLYTVPGTTQPVSDASGRTNMREMTKKQGGRSLIQAISRAFGVKTSGAAYSWQTTTPIQRRNSGGPIYLNPGNVVPGPNINADVVPAMLTPGEFVVNREATAKNLPLLQAINGSGSRGPGYNSGSNGSIGRMEPRLSGVTPAEMRSAFPDRFRGNASSYRLRGTAGIYIGNITDPEIVNRYGYLSRDGRSITVEAINARMATGGVAPEVFEAAMRASGHLHTGSSDQLLHALSQNGIITQEESRRIATQIDNEYRSYIRRQGAIRDAANNYWGISDRVIQRELRLNNRALGFWHEFSSNPAYIVSESLRSSGEPMRSPSMQLKTITHNGETISIAPLVGRRGQSLFAHTATPQPFLQRLLRSGISSLVRRNAPFGWNMRNRGGLIGLNSGGMVPGYAGGGSVGGYTLTDLKYVLSRFGLSSAFRSQVDRKSTCLNSSHT